MIEVGFCLERQRKERFPNFQVQEHRHSGGSDRYSVLEEPEPRLANAQGQGQGQGHEDKLASRLNEHFGPKRSPPTDQQRSPQNGQQYLIDVTASVPVAVPLLTHPDLLRCVRLFYRTN